MSQQRALVKGFLSPCNCHSRKKKQGESSYTSQFVRWLKYWRMSEYEEWDGGSAERGDSEQFYNQWEANQTDDRIVYMCYWVHVTKVASVAWIPKMLEFSIRHRQDLHWVWRLMPSHCSNSQKITPREKLQFSLSLHVSDFTHPPIIERNTLENPKRNLKSVGDRSFSFIAQLSEIRFLLACGISPLSLTSKPSSKPVSYTHLTLPTRRTV